jgi:hypothetical protein
LHLFHYDWGFVFTLDVTFLLLNVETWEEPCFAWVRPFGSEREADRHKKRAANLNNGRFHIANLVLLSAVLCLRVIAACHVKGWSSPLARCGHRRIDRTTRRTAMTRTAERSFVRNAKTDFIRLVI